tara:strand:+ start:134 stop:493 length:360 start_codon:yes stop_codon:yes gene_type:complete
MPTIRLKRAYEAPDPADGVRILVERLWPRGLAKEAAALDHWIKDVAPSADLRTWYGHDPEKWPAFRARYRAELDANGDAVEAVRHLCAGGPATFIFAAKDEERNSAVVLRDYLGESAAG